MGLVLPKRNRVAVLYNSITQCFEVQRGGVVLYRGQLFACEEFCRVRELDITNRADLNAIKYSNMPDVEQYSAVH